MNVGLKRKDMLLLLCFYPLRSMMIRDHIHHYRKGRTFKCEIGTLMNQVVLRKIDLATKNEK